jgi:hypothetical protein
LCDFRGSLIKIFIKPIRRYRRRFGSFDEVYANNGQQERLLEDQANNDLGYGKNDERIDDLHPCYNYTSIKKQFVWAQGNIHVWAKSIDESGFKD